MAQLNFSLNNADEFSKALLAKFFENGFGA